MMLRAVAGLHYPKIEPVCSFSVPPSIPQWVVDHCLVGEIEAH